MKQSSCTFLINARGEGGGQSVSGSRSVATFTATCYCHTAGEETSLDGSDMSNYRPVYNLSFMSKVVERVTAVSN